MLRKVMSLVLLIALVAVTAPVQAAPAAENTPQVVDQLFEWLQQQLEGLGLEAVFAAGGGQMDPNGAPGAAPPPEDPQQDSQDATEPWPLIEPLP
ncbi:MAG TPA: hypothetical protein VHQ65_07125 [Thermoanaerobaculia bacterium]|nr:hypothetical protein [Thermoanaerobaculia bacterium]